MRALLDVNVLVALLDSDHSCASNAAQWYGKHAHLGWASCPLTQNGCVRVMSLPAYPQRVPPKSVAERLEEAIRNSRHEFWSDDISLLDNKRVDLTRIHRPNDVTDAYLLALAISKGGRLVTFDRSISIAGVPGARDEHLVIL